jgi:YggT family protein
MAILQPAFLRPVSAILFVYLLILSLRIILTWFQGSYYGKAWEYLRKITDPYLRMFRGIKFLHVGMFDFTPIAAFMFLIIILNVLNALIVSGTLSFGIFLGIVIRAVWNSLAWLLFIFAILCGIRVFGLLAGGSQTHPAWNTIDLMLSPITSLIERILNRKLEYTQALFVAIAALIGVWLVGGLIMRILIGLVFRLPF